MTDGAPAPPLPPRPAPQRFALLQQRISRNRLFTRPALGSAAPTDGHRYCELTPLQGLLGTAGEQHYIMGSLSQLEDGRFYLEDLTASIQVDLSAAATTAGLFTENCVVVAEGSLNHHGVFEVSALGFPPAETRGETLSVTVGVDFFGAGALRPADRQRLEELQPQAASDMFIVLADVWLDKPEVVRGLKAILEGFTDDPPAAFVLMGDFQSSAFGPVSANLGRMKGAPVRGVCVWDRGRASACLWPTPSPRVAARAFLSAAAACRSRPHPPPTTSVSARVHPQTPSPTSRTSSRSSRRSPSAPASSSCRVRGTSAPPPRSRGRRSRRASRGR